MTRTEELTFRCISFLDLLPKEHPELTDYDYALTKGTGVAHGLVNNTEYSVARINLSPESEIPWHTDVYNEYYIILSGCLELSIRQRDDTPAKKIIKANKGDIFYIRTGTQHKLNTGEKDCRMLAISVPGTLELPKGETDGWF